MMPDKYEEEIIDLHQYFEDWFTGKLEKTEINASRLPDALADDFHIIASNGRITPRDTLIPALFNAYGTQSDFRIWIENVV
ncbi:MAG: hypothetical protein Q9P01_10470 [Anaerolineae bacterium]|nr:hypothetical protein [Anaerolineae bacterium]